MYIIVNIYIYCILVYVTHVFILYRQSPASRSEHCLHGRQAVQPDKRHPVLHLRRVSETPCPAPPGRAEVEAASVRPEAICDEKGM